VRRAAQALAASLVAVALATLPLVSCGGGGGGGGGGMTPPTMPQTGVMFTAGSATAPAIRLTRGAGSSGTVLEVEVRSDSVNDLYGVAFDLTFPSSVLRYDGYSEGSQLSSGGTQTSLQVAQAGSGQLVIGHSRLGDVAGSSGSGVLLTLRFTAISSGSGSLSFAANQAFDSAGDALGDVSWAGGTVSATL